MERGNKVTKIKEQKGINSEMDEREWGPVTDWNDLIMSWGVCYLSQCLCLTFAWSLVSDAFFSIFPRLYCKINTLIHWIWVMWQSYHEKIWLRARWWEHVMIKIGWGLKWWHYRVMGNLAEGQDDRTASLWMHKGLGGWLDSVGI